MRLGGVRGAITVTEDSAEAIWAATRQLLEAMIEANGIDEADVASIFFSTTPDLRAAYPARAARDMGWRQTALMGMQEMDVDGGLPRCVRILIHWNTSKPPSELQHVFMGDAVQLRPDLVPGEDQRLGTNGRHETEA
jgi:chorismate mutase